MINSFPRYNCREKNLALVGHIWPLKQINKKAVGGGKIGKR